MRLERVFFFLCCFILWGGFKEVVAEERARIDILPTQVSAERNGIIVSIDGKDIQEARLLVSFSEGYQAIPMKGVADRFAAKVVFSDHPIGTAYVQGRTVMGKTLESNSITLTRPNTRELQSEVDALAREVEHLKSISNSAEKVSALIGEEKKMLEEARDRVDKKRREYLARQQDLKDYAANFRAMLQVLPQNEAESIKRLFDKNIYDLIQGEGQ